MENIFNVERPNNDLQQVLSFAGADGDHKNEMESDTAENRKINSDDPADLAYWANQFQIGVSNLKAAIVINGNSVREIKKYLSV